jgi:hypothetical protein
MIPVRRDGMLTEINLSSNLNDKCVLNPLTPDYSSNMILLSLNFAIIFTKIY